MEGVCQVKLAHLGCAAPPKLQLFDEGVLCCFEECVPKPHYADSPEHWLTASCALWHKLYHV